MTLSNNGSSMVMGPTYVTDHYGTSMGMFPPLDINSATITCSTLDSYTINSSFTSNINPIIGKLMTDQSLNAINSSPIKTKLLFDFIAALKFMNDDSVMVDEIENTINLWSTLNKVS